MGKAAEKDDEAIDKNRSGKAKNNKGEGKGTQESGKEPQEKDREEGQRVAYHRLVFGLFGGGILPRKRVKAYEIEGKCREEQHRWLPLPVEIQEIT